MNRPVLAVRVGVALVATLLLAPPLQAQKAQEITEAVLEAFLRAHAAEEAETEKIQPELEELDQKIKAFEECKIAFEAAGEATGSRLGGIAARAAMKAKCGASSSDGFYKDREKLLERPEKVALSAGGFKADAYGSLKARLQSWVGGYHDGFSEAELALLRGRGDALAGAFRMALVAPGGGGGDAGGRRGRRGAPGVPGAWSTDYAWEHIGFMMSTMYVSGATMFEKPYQPGQWTRWQMTQSWNSEERTIIERAFLARTEDGSEWWRTSWIDIYPDGDGKEMADTVVLEALFKPVDEYVKQLVRMRGRMPGNAEPQELLVPQHLTMLSSLPFPWRPTEESLQGATVGTETVTAGGTSFNARHVRFAGGDGTIEWWLADDAPGGWVRFRNVQPIEGEEPEVWSMDLIEQGTGAKSELGVI